MLENELKMQILVKEDEADIHKCERGQKSTEHKKSLRYEPFCKLFCFLLEINSVSLYVLDPTYTIK